MGWAGCTIRRFAETDSTNWQARLWAREGAPHGAVVVADVQKAGRGRRGRAWISSPGAGLWLSMVIRLSDEMLPRLPFAAALAAADACRAVTGADVRIKWPNDLVLSGRKICGILAEKEGNAAVIGIGINVRQRLCDFPPELHETAGSLEMLTEKPTSIDALESALLAELERRIDSGAIMDEYAARCVTLGARVRVLEINETFTGVAEGLDTSGALLVRDDSGALRRVLAGDVSVRGMMGYA